MKPKKTKTSAAFVFCVLVTSLALSSCAFRLTTLGSSLANRHPEIFVPMFQNKVTAYPGIEALFTKSLKKKLTAINISSSSRQASTRIVGTILSIENDPQTQTTTPHSSEKILNSSSELKVTLKVTLWDTEKQEKLWEHTFSKYAIYPLSYISQKRANLLNSTYNSHTEKHHLNRLSQQFADEVVHQLINYL